MRIPCLLPTAVRALLLVATLALSAPAPLSAAAPAALPFPTEIASTVTAPRELLAESEELNQWIGQYPPRIRDDTHRQEIYTRWKQTLAAARALHARDGDNPATLTLLGRLYRQGHNLDVRQSAEEAVRLFARALPAWPDSDALHLEASYFYLSIDPTYAPKGEAALLRLRQLRGTDRDLSIERGFIFAYVYQNRIDDAKRQIDHCLTLAPQDKMLLAFRDSLKGKAGIEWVKDGAAPKK